MPFGGRAWDVAARLEAWARVEMLLLFAFCLYAVNQVSSCFRVRGLCFETTLQNSSSFFLEPGLEKDLPAPITGGSVFLVVG